MRFNSKNPFKPSTNKSKFNAVILTLSKQEKSTIKPLNFQKKPRKNLEKTLINKFQKNKTININFILLIRFKIIIIKQQIYFKLIKQLIFMFHVKHKKRYTH